MLLGQQHAVSGLREVAQGGGRGQGQARSHAPRAATAPRSLRRQGPCLGGTHWFHVCTQGCIMHTTHWQPRTRISAGCLGWARCVAWEEGRDVPLPTTRQHHPLHPSACMLCAQLGSPGRAVSIRGFFAVISWKASGPPLSVATTAFLLQVPRRRTLALAASQPSPRPSSRSHPRPAAAAAAPPRSAALRPLQTTTRSPKGTFSFLQW